VGEDDIAPEVRTFLASHIESVLQLEVLLLMRSRAGETWTAESVSREFRIDPTWTEQQLANLAALGALAREAGGAYRYGPASESLERVISATADAYGTHRVTLIGLIFSKPPSPLRSFADAFRLRKDSKDSNRERHDG
jgi:hypothetical protein